MLKPENKIDKQRFEQQKAAEISRGESKQDAIQQAALDTKEVRQLEGRSKNEQGESRSPGKRMG